MANGILCTNKRITASGVIFGSSTEIDGYPKENVRIYQPGESFRTSVLTPGYIQASSITFPVDTIAALYTNATRHRNMLYQSNEFDESVWTATNVIPSIKTTSSAAPEATYSWNLTDDATSGEHSLAQELDYTADELPTPPASSTWTSNYFTTAFYVTRTAGTLDVHLRLQTFSNEYVGYSFDLDTGTLGSQSASGTDWSNASASIAPATAILGSGNWYRIVVTAECSSGSRNTITSKLMLESGGNLSYSGSGEVIRAQAATLENGFTTASAWVPTTTDHASFVRYSSGASPLVGWQHAVRLDRRDEPFVHLVRKASLAVVVTFPRIEIFDDGNLDGYLEFGNLVVGKAFQPTYNISQDWSIGWAEEGASSRTPGGQLYRPVNKRYRRLSMTHQWLTEVEAFEESFEIDRLVGRSDGILAVVDPDSDYKNQWTIWGVQDSLGDTLHRRYVKELGTRVYAKQWNIVEALP